MATGYEYRPLDVEKEEIRLLSIDYRSFGENETLPFQLEHANFKDGVPEYIAISYVWGDATERRNILVDGQDVSVPQNAEIALRRLHRAVLTSSVLETVKPQTITSLGHPQLKFWIDSVCANQSDMEERGHQVSIMWRIYSSAKFVLIWLGPEDGKTTAAIKEIDNLFNDMQRATNDFADASTTLWSLQGGYGYRNIREISLNHLDWSAVEAFYSATWFRRLWVVQETVLAEEAYCVQGHTVIPWTNVGRAAQWLRYSGYARFPNLSSQLRGVKCAADIQDYRDGYLDREDIFLEANLWQVSDAHDKVFGFIGILQVTNSGREFLRTVMRPDYSAPIDVLYGQATRSYISVNNSLRILSDVHTALFKYRDQAPDLSRPSWILKLDFDEAEIRRPLPLRPLNASGKDACNGSVPKLNDIVLDPRVLSLHGYIVDQIHALAPYDVVWDDLNELKRLVTTSYEFARQFGCPSYESFGTILYVDRRVRREGDAISWAKWPDFLRWCMSEDAFDEIAEHYGAILSRYVVGRRLFVTQNGFLGMGTWNVKVGDDVCILSGGGVPYVLRSATDYADSWRYIGDAYVDGIMDGEYIQQLEREGRLEAESRWINIR